MEGIKSKKNTRKTKPVSNFYSPNYFDFLRIFANWIRITSLLVQLKYKPLKYLPIIEFCNSAQYSSEIGGWGDSSFLTLLNSLTFWEVHIRDISLVTLWSILTNFFKIKNKQIKAFYKLMRGNTLQNSLNF